MSLKIRHFVSLLFGGFFFISDQSLKWRALHTWTEPKVFHNFIGWNPFLNPGIAFGIPVPNILIIILTLPIIFALLYALLNPKGFSFLKAAGSTRSSSFLSQDFFTWLSALLIFVGATSNLVDRIFFHNTIDYILVFTAIINLADVLIVSGFVIYFSRTLNKNSNYKY